MSKVALVSYDVQTIRGRAGGVGAFVRHFSQVLAEGGHDVTIIASRAETQPTPVDPEWHETYRSWGVKVIEVHNTPAVRYQWPNVWAMRLSERVAPLLRAFDVAYFQDWGNLAFHTVRVKRFGSTPSPLCVTVLHGPQSWVNSVHERPLNFPFDLNPAVANGLNQDYIERYSALHSDFVVSPSAYLRDWLKTQGWRFREEPAVLGLPYRPAAWTRKTPPVTRFRRLVFFGRLEVGKGFRLFAEALRLLAGESRETLKHLREIVLLGQEREKNAVREVRRQIAQMGLRGLRVIHLADFNSDAAVGYLADHVADTLVVIPSLAENFSYAVIETSTIPGLNLICSRGGGTSEIFAGAGQAQFFDPLPRDLAAKLVERLQSPLAPEQLATYDFEAANSRWLDFHQRICDQQPSKHHAGAQSRVLSEPDATAPRRRNFGNAQVDVCITYYNKARYFPQLLEALARQTSRDFTVFAADDGSPDPAARAVFDEMAEKYSPQGWTFFRQPNAFLDTARNRLAQRGTSEFLMFMDADDLLALNAVGRMIEAIRLSGDDCLVPWSFLFTGEAWPYNPDTGEITGTAFAYYTPLGPDAVAGLLEPVNFGVATSLIRRRVFEAIGGYREIRGAPHEDWELYARLALRGYAVDILPEYLHFYRQVNDGLSRTLEESAGKRRLTEAYDLHLDQIGMYGTASALFALHRRTLKLEGQIKMLERRMSGHSTRLQIFDPERGHFRNDGVLAGLAAAGRASRWLRPLRRIYRLGRRWSQ